MKTAITILSILFVIACHQNPSKYTGEKYIVETTVMVKPSSVNEVLELFKVTNPELVKDEADWLSASFAGSDEMDVVVVRAVWKSKASYLAFSNSAKFKETMSQFGQYFEQKPEVRITKVLFEM